MIRLHGAFLLLAKLSVYCANAGDKQIKRLRLGHFWGSAVTALAAVSRIW